ncbi:helix-turn-helix domain-containing protein [Streptomyces guryensis]|uniref:AraC family transcriptional regulator n=1 Tax=Streptomyces guryensis TaxID=2886947 RepID=A0A9Q3VXJ1_9ACTN|nr:AraC family transcriptional regulator [Streptomyces guryensis]MCD9879557.1 AraC family transcriptional regulator [Streptomyces guryensis]
MRTEATVPDLVRTLAAPRLGGPSALPAMSSRLTMARAPMDRHLSDPGLSTERVAEALGVSPRRLIRIFRPSGVAPARHARDQLPAQAREQLADPAFRPLTVAEVAPHRGFAGQARFTRVFHRPYAGGGPTPRGGPADGAAARLNGLGATGLARQRVRAPHAAVAARIAGKSVHDR